LEETLRIKLKLLQTKANKRLKSIMVTSANHGEGASILVANLALAFALDGKSRILLVDANIRQPNLHVLFGIEQEKGFLDFISGNTELAETIKETAFPNIHLMTAGQPRRNDVLTTLAAISQDAKNSIETGFDLVLYDTAPVNSYPDTLMTTTLADGIILVILAEKTRYEAVAKARKSLEAIEAHILGGVLNERK
jgi:capsular exopolysaccharide synthesis family protein